MDRTKVIWGAFAIMVAIQLYFPAKMIVDSKDILKSGTEYRFKTAPVDPYDPFRGKFINLNFSDNSCFGDDNEWLVNEEVYAILDANSDGFAFISYIEKEAPKDLKNYIKVKIHSVDTFETKKITVEYPFNKFFMEETKAPIAEQVYNESQNDTLSNTYAVVVVKNGEAVLLDVEIDGKSIREIAKESQIPK